MEKGETIFGSSEELGTEAVSNQHSTRQPDGIGGQEDASTAHGDEPGKSEPSDRRKEILKALEAVERDSAAIAESFTSLFASLRLSLSQATSSTVDHMNCFSDAAGRLQESELMGGRVLGFSVERNSVLDASTKGNRYINSCLRLNEEMKGMDTLATQLKVLRRHVDALDSVVTRLVRLP